jgi:hypothetical protein
MQGHALHSAQRFKQSAWEVCVLSKHCGRSVSRTLRCASFSADGSHAAQGGLPRALPAPARGASSSRVHRLRAVQYDETVVGSKSALNGTCLKLFYRTGWDSARIHGSLLGGSWQDYALQKVGQQQQQQVPGSQHVQEPGREHAPATAT